MSPPSIARPPRPCVLSLPILMTAFATAQLTAICPVAAAQQVDPNDPNSAAVSRELKPLASPHRQKLEDAWRAMDLSNWGRSRELFGQVRDDSAADPNDQAEAIFGLGQLAQYETGERDLDEAREQYNSIIDRFGKTRVTPHAMMAMARIADMPPDRDNQDLGQARKLYNQILKDYPGHTLAHESALWLAVSYLADIKDPNSHDKGAEILRKYVAKYPQNFCAAIMYMHLAAYHHRQENWKEFVKYRIASYEAGIPSKTERSGAAFMIAQVAERKLKDYELAIEWYRVIVEEIVTTNKYYIAKESIQRLRKKIQEDGHGES